MGATLGKIFVDPKTLPQDFGGFLQLVYLGATYGFVLCTSSGWIGDGSELLLLIPALAGIVGSVVLPVLGAIPDGAIVLFSGLGDDAQLQLNVGIGALAGSTVMLLTVPWALSVYAGRVVLNPDGSGRYKDKPKLSPANRIAGTGVNCDVVAITYAAKWMIGTSLAIVIVQGAGFFDKCGTKDQIDKSNCNVQGERTFALVALIVAFIGFVAYLVDQIRLSGKDTAKTDLIDQVRKKALAAGQITLRGVFNVGEETKVSKEDKQFKSVVTSFFNKYDTDGSGSMDTQELAVLLRDLGEGREGEDLTKMAKQMDTNGNGVIELDEFITAMANIVNSGHIETSRRPSVVGAEKPPKGSGLEPALKGGSGEGLDAAEEEESDEEEEVPEDLVNLSPDVQRRKILQRACLWMFSGVFVVLLFSDPMVDVLTELGDRIGVNPFYISFILCPLASNASEIIASYGYASKKTSKTMTVSLSTLLGAAIMNNTFCLVIFLVLIVFKELIWEFSAETICILFVEIVMFFIATRKFHPTWTGFAALALLPISLVIVVVLESAGLN